jgi:hypothetical protein
MSTPRWEWQDYYLEALLDTNPMNVFERVEAAEKAISSRTRELRASPDGEVERQAIADALSDLAILKRESKSIPKLRPAARSSK